MMQRQFLARSAAFLLIAAALAGCATSGYGLEQETARPQERIRDSLQKAQDLRQSGDPAAAIKILGPLLLAAPDDPTVVGEYGKALVAQGRGNEAITFLNRAIMLSGNDWKLYSALGVACDSNGDSVKARNAYEHALKLQPGEPSVLNNYALSRMMSGDVAGALDLIRQAAAASKDPKIARNLAMLESLAKTLPSPPPAAAATPPHRPTGRDFNPGKDDSAPPQKTETSE